MSGKGCFTDPPVAFQPSKDGLVAWYDSNSAVFSGTSLSSWKDRNEYENNLISEGDLPITSNFNFNLNNLFKYGIEFQKQTTGASIFIVCSFCNNIAYAGNIIANNMVTIFSSNYRAAQPSNAAFSVSMFNYSATSRSNFIINTYDLLNNYATYSNQLSVLSYTGKQILNAICFNSNFNGSYSRAYINGSNVSCNSSLINISSDINTYNLWLGDQPRNVNYGPDGVRHLTSGTYSMFEVLVYNRVLSQSEISSVNRYLAAKNSTTALANSGNFQY